MKNTEYVLLYHNLPKKYKIVYIIILGKNLRKV